MSHPTVAHQFDDLAQQREAVTLGMWAFLGTEIMFFGGALIAYGVYRSAYPQAFAAASHEENWLIGGINTAVLLCSSLTVALAVHAAGQRRPRRIVACLLATIVLGLAFVLIKGHEYYVIISHHHAPWGGFEFEPSHLARPARVFFSFYFFLTGLHATHMIVGFGLMAWLILLARRGRFDAGNINSVEMVGLYWHFVDIVWIFLYPLFYLVDRS